MGFELPYVLGGCGLRDEEGLGCPGEASVPIDLKKRVGAMVEHPLPIIRNSY